MNERPECLIELDAGNELIFPTMIVLGDELVFILQLGKRML